MVLFGGFNEKQRQQTKLQTQKDKKNSCIDRLDRLDLSIALAWTFWQVGRHVPRAPDKPEICLKIKMQTSVQSDD
jgi:hypothetical protein